MDGWMGAVQHTREVWVGCELGNEGGEEVVAREGDDGNNGAEERGLREEGAA